MKGHLELTTCRNLRKLGASLGHDGLSTGLDVVGASAEGLANSRTGSTTEAGGILLEGVASGSVTGSGGVNTESHANTASVANGVDDGSVARDELGTSQEDGENGNLGEHFGG